MPHVQHSISHIRTNNSLRHCANMFMFILLCLCIANVMGTESTLPGECPNMELEENLDYTKFSGVWYNIANYASDGRVTNDCAILEFTEDNLGFIMKETFVEPLEKRTQKQYTARVDPMFDAGNQAKFVVSYEDGDKVLQFPFSILSTDYDDYAVAYTCKTLKKKIRTHYVFAWVLTRSKDNLPQSTLKKVEDALSKYTDLAEHRQSLKFKEFTNETCSFDSRYETDFLTNNFWQQ